MSCADIMFSAALFFGEWSFNHSICCRIQGFVFQACGQITQIWCTSVGINLILQMTLFWQDGRCRTMMWWYHLAAWGWGISSGIIAWSKMERAGAWCWIGEDYPEWRFGLFYGPLWMLFSINIFTIGTIIRRLYKLLNGIPSEQGQRKNISRHYRWVSLLTVLFVAVGILVWIPGTINRVWEAVNDNNNSPYAAQFFHVLMTPAQGTFNFLVYVVPLYWNTYCLRNKQELQEVAPKDSTEISSNKPSPEGDFLSTPDLDFDDSSFEVTSFRGSPKIIIPGQQTGSKQGVTVSSSGTSMPNHSLSHRITPNFYKLTSFLGVTPSSEMSPAGGDSDSMKVPGSEVEDVKTFVNPFRRPGNRVPSSPLAHMTLHQHNLVPLVHFNEKLLPEWEARKLRIKLNLPQERMKPAVPITLFKNVSTKASKDFMFPNPGQTILQRKAKSLNIAGYRSVDL